MNSADANILNDIEKMIRAARIREAKLYRDIKIIKVQFVIFLLITIGWVIVSIGVK